MEGKWNSSILLEKGFFPRSWRVDLSSSLRRMSKEDITLRGKSWFGVFVVRRDLAIHDIYFLVYFLPTFIS